MTWILGILLIWLSCFFTMWQDAGWEAKPGNILRSWRLTDRIPAADLWHIVGILRGGWFFWLMVLWLFVVDLSAGWTVNVVRIGVAALGAQVAAGLGKRAGGKTWDHLIVQIWKGLFR